MSETRFGYTPEGAGDSGAPGQDEVTEADLLGLDLEALTFVGEVPQDELPPAPESTSDVLVVRTYRVSVEMDEWITRTTREHGIRSNSELVRELLELGRAAMESNDRQVSMADVLRALAQVRSRNAA
jgi:hypothetical protein